MGAIGNAVTGMLQGGKKDPALRQQLESDPRGVIEREVGRKLTDEEFEAALAELKRNGFNVKHGAS